MTWESYFGNACSAVEAPEPGDPEFDAFETINRDVFDQLGSGDRLQLECNTRIRCGVPASN